MTVISSSFTGNLTGYDILNGGKSVTIITNFMYMHILY